MGRRVQVKHVNAKLFSSPSSTPRDGGTAAFFELTHTGGRCPPGGANHWIGKDLSHARDELLFYEGIGKLCSRYRLLHQWAVPYCGVLTARCTVDGKLEEDARQLLVLRNLHDGAKKLRMLDIKIGEETALAGWKGKSWKGALTNRIVDHMTNSVKQGFRLEGMDNPPRELLSRMEGPSQALFSLDGNKRYKRFQLQCLRAQQFLQFWCDTDEMQSQWLGDASRLSPLEYSECILFDGICQLASLSVDAQLMPVPQMWLGSSLALACDVGALPLRQEMLDALECLQSPAAARVSLFDWGRSELNTECLHRSLSDEEQSLREAYWVLWQRGMLRVIFDAIVDYQRMFGWGLSKGAATSLGEVIVEVWDFDTLSPSSLIGCVRIPLQQTCGPRFFVLDCSGAESRVAFQFLNLLDAAVGKEGGLPTLKAEVSTTALPQRSRLAQEAWHVTVHSVHDLPNMDVFGKTDPLVRVKIRSPGTHVGAVADSHVVYNHNTAMVNTRLDFGASRPHVVRSLYGVLGRMWGDALDPKLFVAAAAHDPEADDAAEQESAHFEKFLSKVRRFRGLCRDLG